MTNAEISVQPEALPTETPTGNGASHQEAVCDPQVMEGHGECCEGQQACYFVFCSWSLWMYPLKVRMQSREAEIPADAGVSSGRASISMS